MKENGCVFSNWLYSKNKVLPRLFYSWWAPPDGHCRARRVGGRRVCTPEDVIGHPGKGPRALRRCRTVVATQESGAYP